MFWYKGEQKKILKILQRNANWFFFPQIEINFYKLNIAGFSI